MVFHPTPIQNNMFQKSIVKTSKLVMLFSNFSGSEKRWKIDSVKPWGEEPLQRPEEIFPMLGDMPPNQTAAGA